jgi:DNA-binding response OmpR family regulator
MDSSTSVLLVDDDTSLAHSICDLLIILGFEVTWKADRAQAVAALCSPQRFDVVLLDLRLGIERGEQVIHDARSHGCSIPPIVILSAQPDLELVAAAQISRAACVLRKPCTAQGIKIAIENAVA